MQHPILHMISNPKKYQYNSILFYNSFKIVQITIQTRVSIHLRIVFLVAYLHNVRQKNK